MYDIKWNWIKYNWKTNIIQFLKYVEFTPESYALHWLQKKKKKSDSHLLLSAVKLLLCSLTPNKAEWAEKMESAQPDVKYTVNYLLTMLHNFHP